MWQEDLIVWPRVQFSRIRADQPGPYTTRQRTGLTGQYTTGWQYI